MSRVLQIRLSGEDWVTLERAAGDRPISVWARSVLLAEVGRQTEVVAEPPGKPLPPEMQKVMEKEAVVVNRQIGRELSKPVDLKKPISKAEFPVAGLSGHPSIQAVLGRVKPPVAPDLGVAQKSG